MGLAVIRYISPEQDCFKDLYWALHNINHTGQEGCGFAFSDGKKITHQAYDGLVRSFVRKEGLGGYCGISNVNVIKDHQPRIFDHRRHGKFALSFDGFVVNEAQLREDCNETFSTPYQVELVAKLIGQGKDFPEGIENVAKKVLGAYCLAVINEKGEIYVARDPLAIRPLIHGKGEMGFGVATESRSLDKTEMIDLRDFEPGEICMVDQYGVHTVKHVEGPNGRKRKHCSFLWGYYSSPDSIIEGIAVNLVRERAGATLARKDIEDGLKFDIVSPVPDSGKPYAEGYAEASRKPYVEALIKYSLALKSYLRPTQDARDEEADMKLNVVKSRAKGRRIVLTEDSIRRCTQLKRVPIRLLRESGAKEIHLRIGTPRNTAYCRLDAREKGDETLIANQLKTDKEVAEFLGVDSVRYISEDDFVAALTDESDLTRDDFCLGCYNRDFGFLGEKALEIIEI